MNKNKYILSFGMNIDFFVKTYTLFQLINDFKQEFLFLYYIFLPLEEVILNKFDNNLHAKKLFYSLQNKTYYNKEKSYLF
jgi:hypothetical protein